MNSGWLGWGILAVGLVASLWWDKRRKSRAAPGVVPLAFVRVRPPASNVFRNLIVLAVVVSLGWFFWYVMGTRCNGGC
jgi:hypothetical protein